MESKGLKVGMGQIDGRTDRRTIGRTECNALCGLLGGGGRIIIVLGEELTEVTPASSVLTQSNSRRTGGNYQQFVVTCIHVYTLTTY